MTICPAKVEEVVNALAESGVCPKPYADPALSCECNLSCDKCWANYLNNTDPLKVCHTCGVVTNQACECDAK